MNSVKIQIIPHLCGLVPMIKPHWHITDLFFFFCSSRSRIAEELLHHRSPRSLQEFPKQYFYGASVKKKNQFKRGGIIDQITLGEANSYTLLYYWTTKAFTVDWAWYSQCSPFSKLFGQQTFISSFRPYLAVLGTISNSVLRRHHARPRINAVLLHINQMLQPFPFSPTFGSILRGEYHF